jgi:hypothetical protein
MTGFTDLSARAYLDQLVTDYPYLGLFTVAGIDAGTGFTEVSTFAYARANTTGLWASAAGSAPATKTNSSIITFPTDTGGDWGILVAWGLFSLATSGNLGFWDYLGNFAWQPYFNDSSSPAILRVKAHGFSVGNTVISNAEYGGTGPTFSQSNFNGALLVAHAATDTFDVTNGGLAVNTSSTGSGLVRKIAPQNIIAGTTPIFPVSSFVLSAA